MKPSDYVMVLIQFAVYALIAFFILRGIKNRRKRKEAEAAAASAEKKKGTLFEITMMEQGFVIDKKVAYGKFALYLDNEHKQWCLKKADDPSPAVYRFSDLRAFTLNDNGEVIVSRDTTGMIVGALMFGVIGAVLGANRTETDTCNRLEIHMEVAGVDSGMDVPLIAWPTARYTDQYKEAVEAAQKMMASFAYMQDDSQNGQEPNPLEIENEQGTNPVAAMPPEGDDVVEKMRQLEEQMANGTISEKDYKIQRGILLRRI